jgi:hypothetical protein
MKLNIKTLKGTTFEIEAAAEASVRTPPLLAPLSFRSSRVNMGGSVRFRGGWPRCAWRLCCRAGFDLNLGFQGVLRAAGGWLGLFTALCGARNRNRDREMVFSWYAVLGFPVDWCLIGGC